MVIFDPKEKEPILSFELQDVLNRSMGKDITQGNNQCISMDSVFRYKYKIMQLLTHNEDLLSALHGSIPVSNGDAYRNIHIFDYLRLPELKDTVKNYVCFDVDEIGYGGEVIGTKLTFRTVSYQDDIETDYSISRHDLLALIIKEQLDWSNELGMTIRKESDRGNVTTSGYYYRELVYNIQNPNNTINQVRNKF